jgi:hypothetical protein
MAGTLTYCSVVLGLPIASTVPQPMTKKSVAGVGLRAHATGALVLGRASASSATSPYRVAGSYCGFFL